MEKMNEKTKFYVENMRAQIWLKKFFLKSNTEKTKKKTKQKLSFSLYSTRVQTFIYALQRNYTFNF